MSKSLLIILVSVILALNAAESNNTANLKHVKILGEKLFQQLGLRNQTHVDHMIRKRSITDHNSSVDDNIDQNVHMMKLYNKLNRNTNYPTLKSYNMIRSIFGKIFFLNEKLTQILIKFY